MPPISGGYLIINLDGKEFCIVSVPSPVLVASRYRDSITDNHEMLEDKNGNVFSITVWSSNIGVDWEMDITTSGNEETLKNRIDVEYQANGF